MNNNNYIPLEEVDLDDLYHSIWQFKEAYKRCFEPAPLLLNGVNKELYVPAIVNLSFVLELEMKFLSLISKGACLKTHNLHSLFCDLPKAYVCDPFFTPKKYVFDKLKDFKLIFNNARYSFNKKHYDVNSKNFLEPFEERMFKLIERDYKK